MKILRIFFLSFNLVFSFSFNVQAQVGAGLSGSAASIANSGSTVVSADGLTQQDLLADAMNMFDNLGLSVNESVINFIGGLDFSPTVIASVDPNSCEISIRESILTSSGTQEGSASRCYGGSGTSALACESSGGIWLSQEQKVTSQIQQTERLMESISSLWSHFVQARTGTFSLHRVTHDFGTKYEKMFRVIRMYKAYIKERAKIQQKELIAAAKERKKSNTDLATEGENSEATGLETLKVLIDINRKQSHMSRLYAVLFSQAAGINSNDLAVIGEDGTTQNKRYMDHFKVSTAVNPGSDDYKVDTLAKIEKELQAGLTGKDVFGHDFSFANFRRVFCGTAESNCDYHHVNVTLGGEEVTLVSPIAANFEGQPNESALLQGENFSDVAVTQEDLNRVKNSTSSYYSVGGYFQGDEIMIKGNSDKIFLRNPKLATSGTNLLTGFYGNAYNKFIGADLNNIFENSEIVGGAVLGSSVSSNEPENERSVGEQIFEGIATEVGRTNTNPYRCSGVLVGSNGFDVNLNSFEEFKVCGARGCSYCLDDDCGGPDKVGSQELKYDIDQSRFNIIDPLLHQAFFGSSMLTNAIGDTFSLYRRDVLPDIMTSVLGENVLDIIGGIDQVGAVQQLLTPDFFSGMAVEAFTNGGAATALSGGGSAPQFELGNADAAVTSNATRGLASQIDQELLQANNLEDIQQDLRNSVNEIESQFRDQELNIFTAVDSMYASLDKYEKARWKTGMALLDHTIAMHRVVSSLYGGENQLFLAPIYQIKNLTLLSEYAASYHTAMQHAFTERADCLTGKVKDISRRLGGVINTDVEPEEGQELSETAIAQNNQRREAVDARVDAELSTITTTTIGTEPENCMPREFIGLGSGGTGSLVNNSRRNFQPEFAQNARISNNNNSAAGFNIVTPDIDVGAFSGTVNKDGSKGSVGDKVAKNSQKISSLEFKKILGARLDRKNKERAVLRASLKGKVKFPKDKVATVLKRGTSTGNKALTTAALGTQAGLGLPKLLKTKLAAAEKQKAQKDSAYKKPKIASSRRGGRKTTSSGKRSKRGRKPASVSENSSGYQYDRSMSRGRYITNENDELFDKVSKAYFREGFPRLFGANYEQSFDTQSLPSINSTSKNKKRVDKRRKKGQK